MTTQMNKPLTIKEYAVSQGLSETTVRRRIRAGGLDARIEHGRYFIYGQNGVHPGEHTQNGQMDTQIEQANDKEDSQQSNPVFPERSEQQVLIDRLTSEVDYLRDQLDKQTQLLAASTAQNSDMVARLNPLPRPTWVESVRTRYFTKTAKSDLEA